MDSFGDLGAVSSGIIVEWTDSHPNLVRHLLTPSQLKAK